MRCDKESRIEGKRDSHRNGRQPQRRIEGGAQLVSAGFGSEIATLATQGRAAVYLKGCAEASPGRKTA